MKKSGPSWLILAALVLAGCASEPEHKFANVTPKSSGRSAAAPQAPVIQPAPAASAPPSNADLLHPPENLFTLGPGDQIDVETFGQSPFRATSVVGLDGKIYYSFLPGIDVWGLTLGETKSRIEQELSKYITQPQVSVTLRAVGSKYIWLLGRVAKPGIYPLTGTMTLLEALALAGGTATTPSGTSYNTQDLADLRHSFVMRGGNVLPVDFARLLKGGDMSQNIYLRADDFVYIPSSLSQQVYVLGAVGTPRAVPYSDQMTVVSAIATAGGVVQNAYVSHVGIVRGSLTQPQLIVADYGAISHGQAQNVFIEPGDIVYVPLTPYHVLSDYADFIASTFVRAWSANIGVRAVEGSSSVGISLPVGTIGH